MRNFSKTNYHYFFFIILFLTQIVIFDDYGFSNDEEISRFNGLVTFNYLIEKLNVQFFQPYPNVPKLENYLDKDYGVIFELLLISFEKILNLQDIKIIYLTRHFLLQSSFSLVVYILSNFKNFFFKEYFFVVH